MTDYLSPRQTAVVIAAEAIRDEVWLNKRWWMRRKPSPIHFVPIASAAVAALIDSGADVSGVVRGGPGQ